MIEVTQASANAYKQCEQYRRTCALVRIPGGGTYAVDFFRVNGGKQHQYSFNCNGRLTGLEGVNPKPVERKIKWLANLRADKSDQPVTAVWKHNDVMLDMIMLTPVDDFIVADAPGWRSYQGSEKDAPPIQQILAERSGDTGLKSHFAVVIAPYKGDASPVKSARIVASDHDSGVIAIAVERENRTDYIISAMDDKTRTYGPITMSGRFGFASVDARGKLCKAYLLDGAELKCDKDGISLKKARIPLRVALIEGRTYHLSDTIPEGQKFTGSYLLADGTGYEIESSTKNSITVRDYPAVECKEVIVLNSAWLDK